MDDPRQPIALLVGAWIDQMPGDEATTRLVRAVTQAMPSGITMVGTDWSGIDAAISRGEDPVDGLATLVGQLRPDLVALASGPRTEDLAPRLAARAHGVPALDVRRLRGISSRPEPSDAGRSGLTAGPPTSWTFTRPGFGGAIDINGQIPAGTILVATIDTSTAELPPSVVATVVEIVPLPSSRPSRVQRRATAPRTTDIPLDAAQRIVAGGRGIGGPAGFDDLKLLARSLDAELAASRPPCDAGWVPGRYQVGITGTRVAPDLYLAVGISGSVQHLAGMKDSHQIIAINVDPEAPIFRYADLGVVGDWREVVLGMLDVLGADSPIGLYRPADQAPDATIETVP